MDAHNITIGRSGERAAADWLVAHDFEVIDRNWRCGLGELDIVAVDGDTLVFVEVKTRTGLDCGHPFESITAQKLARLHRLAVAWCQAHPVRPADGIRIDVVAVIAPGGALRRVEHIVDCL